LGVNGGVVHGRGFESLTFVDNGGAVHGRGFESFTFWGQRWCSSAWSWVRIFILGVNGGGVHGRILDFFVVNCGVIAIRKISKANQTPCKSSRPPGLLFKYFPIHTLVLVHHGIAGLSNPGFSNPTELWQSTDGFSKSLVVEELMNQAKYPTNKITNDQTFILISGKCPK
jgi:hypothetical protein